MLKFYGFPLREVRFDQRSRDIILYEEGSCALKGLLTIQ